MFFHLKKIFVKFKRWPMYYPKMIKLYIRKQKITTNLNFHFPSTKDVTHREALNKSSKTRRKLNETKIFTSTYGINKIASLIYTGQWAIKKLSVSTAASKYGNNPVNFNHKAVWGHSGVRNNRIFDGRIRL